MICKTIVTSYKFPKTSKLHLETRPTITAIALPTERLVFLLLNNLHRTLHIQKDVLPSALRQFLCVSASLASIFRKGRIRSPPPTVPTHQELVSHQLTPFQAPKKIRLSTRLVNLRRSLVHKFSWQWKLLHNFTDFVRSVICVRARKGAQKVSPAYLALLYLTTFRFDFGCVLKRGVVRRAGLGTGHVMA